MRISLLLLLFFTAQICTAQDRYVKARASYGDGVLLLLDRYRLGDQACNEGEFYRINKMKKNAPLKEGAEYLIPIKILKYNKKSIMTTLGVKDEALAKRLDAFNKKMVKIGLKNKSYTADLELWVPYGEQNCPGKTFEAPKQRNYPIFGKKLADVPLESSELAGAIYYIIPGHGGPDPGAITRLRKNLLCEDEYAYDVCLRLARNLLKRGARVYIMVQDPNDGIRDAEVLKNDADEKCYPDQEIPLGQKERLHQRTDKINELYEENLKEGYRYQRVIEIHVDSRAKNERIDLFLYHHPDSESGKRFANTLHRMIKTKYAQHRASGSYAGSVIPRDLHTLRESKPTTVFIELGNIRNKYDQQRLILAANRQALADWFMEGLIEDY